MDLLIVVVVSVARVCHMCVRREKTRRSEKKGEEGFFLIVSDRNGLSSTSGRFY